jgi:poly [ADP-ribose] polymerase
MSSLSAACPPCTLHPKTKNLMEIIFDSDMFKSAMVDIKVDLKKMPLGAISSSQLDKGFDILENIKVLVNKKKISSQDRQSIIALSGNFYSVRSCGSIIGVFND